MTVGMDATDALVTGGVVLIVGAGAWLIVGSYLVWALWQLVAFYVVLVAVAVAMYGAPFLAVGRSTRGSTRDRITGD